MLYYPSMENINKTKRISAVLALGILGILTVGFTAPPNQASATTYCTAYSSGVADTGEMVPKPSVSGITPSSGANTRTIRIVGTGFVIDSVAKVDGADRFTTFVDDSHLILEVNPNDLRNSDGFYVTVFNGGLCGGHSNALFFRTGGSDSNNNTNSFSNESNTYNYSNTSENAANTANGNQTNGGYASNLASNALFGNQNSFLPSGLVGWVMLAIIIMIIVILLRKIFGAEQKYQEAPLKHD